ncbi:MAG: J domain-containing protein [Bacteroidetes bacterium]|nr:J domain-containing protein [Bacteroidota bacterium]
MTTDFYHILQISATATQADIKAAYRRLAKLYHPDKNPLAEEKFKQIKEAYETLIDPAKRKKYDYKKNYQTHTSVATSRAPSAKKQKTYTFHEPDLKYRNYYQEHYPKKEPVYAAAPAAPKTNNRELMYLLISIPISIALLLLLLHLYEKPALHHHKAPREAAQEKNTP